jgi:predicted amidohydrolase
VSTLRHRARAGRFPGRRRRRQLRRRCSTWRRRRARDGRDLLLCPELALSGYPPEDLLFHRGFRHQVRDALERVREAARGLGIVVGYPEYSGDAIYNSCALLD